MNKKEFIEKLKEIMQTQEALTPNSNLIDIDGWDSLSMISTAALFDTKFNKRISVKTLQDLDTIKDLIELAGVK